VRRCVLTLCWPWWTDNAITPSSPVPHTSPPLLHVAGGHTYRVRKNVRCGIFDCSRRHCAANSTIFVSIYMQYTHDLMGFRVLVERHHPNAAFAVSLMRVACQLPQASAWRDSSGFGFDARCKVAALEYVNLCTLVDIGKSRAK